MIVTASCGVEPNRVVEYVPIVEQGIAMTESHQKPEVIIFNRPQVLVLKLQAQRVYENFVQIFLTNEFTIQLSD